MWMHRENAANVQCCRHLLLMGANPRAISRSGSTPLYRAARNGSTEAVKILLQAGGQAECVTWDDWTPLHEAVHKGHTNLVRYLLSLGVDTRICAKVGATHQSPLVMATLSGRDDIQELLKAVQGEAGFHVPGAEATEATNLPLRSHKRKATSEDQDNGRHSRRSIDVASINTID